MREKNTLFEGGKPPSRYIPKNISAIFESSNIFDFFEYQIFDIRLFYENFEYYIKAVKPTIEESSRLLIAMSVSLGISLLSLGGFILLLSKAGCF